VVYDQFHDTLPLSLGILESANRPSDGLTSYGTIGLWEAALDWGPGEFPTRLELVGAFPSDKKAFRDILAAAAFNIMRTKRPCFPGYVMPNYVREWYPTTTVPHLYFTSPSLWDAESLTELDLEPEKVNWLQVFPISTDERGFLERNGDDALEDLFVEKDIDIFDLQRGSAVS
jgi:hypothetical protein